MKIAIIGAGFTGLTAALRLAENGHSVTVFEKGKTAGGMAAGFKERGWDWYLDKTYHHLFTNDKSAVNLAKEVNQKLIKKRPETAVLVENQMPPFDSPLNLLRFKNLKITTRLRIGICIFYLKYIAHPKLLKNKFALKWLSTFMGTAATEMIWEPLFEGKFSNQKHVVSLTWFWARIKKRTPSLFYPEGGFQNFAERAEKKAKKMGVEFKYNKEITKKDFKIISLKYNKIIVTTPTENFIKIFALPKNYINRLSSISHLNALNLILILNKPFFPKKTYWLNITDKNFPFLVMAEHTNFVNKKHYGDQHILYIGCYLPDNHPYLKMNPQKLMKLFDPYLQKINPLYKKEIIKYKLFLHKNAQPIISTDYEKKIPEFKTPIKNVYLANLDMVYPWDRGVNYAINMGNRIAKIIEYGSL